MGPEKDPHVAPSEGAGEGVQSLAGLFRASRSLFCLSLPVCVCVCVCVCMLLHLGDTHLAGHPQIFSLRSQQHFTATVTHTDSRHAGRKWEPIHCFDQQHLLSSVAMLGSDTDLLPLSCVMRRRRARRSLQGTGCCFGTVVRKMSVISSSGLSSFPPPPNLQTQISEPP